MSTTTPTTVYYQTRAEFFVNGKPAPQGSKSFKGMRGGKAILVEASKAVKPWREQVTASAQAVWNGQPLLDGAVAVDLGFILPRPKSLGSKPTPPATKRNGDLDKLARAVLDSLTDSIIADDAQVTYLLAEKRTAEPGEEPGVLVTVMANQELEQ